eukprot:scaffold37559_cov66-Phaeocystis_antarctica.AAC.2
MVGTARHRLVAAWSPQGSLGRALGRCLEAKPLGNALGRGGGGALAEMWPGPRLDGAAHRKPHQPAAAAAAAAEALDRRLHPQGDGEGGGEGGAVSDAERRGRDVAAAPVGVVDPHVVRLVEPLEEGGACERRARRRSAARPGSPRHSVGAPRPPALAARARAPHPSAGPRRRPGSAAPCSARPEPGSWSASRGHR